MREILEKVVGVFPAYLQDFLHLITGPKRFVGMRLADKGRLEKALLFLGLSAAITFLLKLPLLRGEPWLELGSSAVFTLLVWGSVGIVIWLAWRLVGGKGSLEGTLVICFYYAGVFEFIVSVTYLGQMGTLRAVDPTVYDELMVAVERGRVLALLTAPDGPFHTLAYRLSMGMILLGFAAALAWGFAGWGAYRSLHGQGKVRSALASVVAAVAWLPVWALTVLLANALMK